MRLIDADKAKAELLAIAETIPAWPGFFDGIRSGYQSAADRLDTMPVVEERKHGHWIELEPDKYGNFIQCSVCDSKFGFYINKNFEKPEDILKCASRNGGYSYNLLCLLIGRAFIKKKPFYPKYGEMVYYVTVSGYIQEVRFDTDSTLHQLLRKAGKLYRSEEEAIRHLDKDHKDLIIQEEE